MQLTKGDKVTVINPFAPYYRREVIVSETDDPGPWPIVCNIEIDGELYPVCYKEDELKPVDAETATEEIPVVVV